MNIHEMSDSFTRYPDLVHLPNQGRPDLPSRVFLPLILLKSPWGGGGVGGWGWGVGWGRGVKTIMQMIL